MTSLLGSEEVSAYAVAALVLAGSEAEQDVEALSLESIRCPSAIATVTCPARLSSLKA